ncbi:MAG: response regulator [Elainellaceae cyanobacterium]
MKILLIEDDALIAEPLAKALADQRYSVDVAEDGQTGWELIETFSYDLILLDVMLPELDGISLCRRLRSQGNQTPILLLTAQDASTDKAVGLDAGADDYVVKPFNLQELLARIRALLRRGNTLLPSRLEWQNLTLDPSACEVTCNGQLLRLTPKEYRLLELFLRNPHRIFSISSLIDHIWSFEEIPSEDTIRSHIRGLRQKLRAAEIATDPIETVYGIGYRLRAVEEQRQIKQRQDKTSRVSQVTEVKSSTLTGISEIWDQVKAAVHERVTVLEQAVALLHQNKLGNELQQQAVQIAHKLVGSLGMFGADQGSRLAREIQHLLEQATSLNQEQTQRLSQLMGELRQELQRLNTNPLPEQVPEHSSVNSHPWLLIVSAHAAQAEALAIEAVSWGMRSQTVANPVAARATISDDRPDAVVLDCIGVASLDNYLTLLAELAACTPPVPSLILTDHNRLLDRVKIARLGGGWVLQQPISPVQVLEAINQRLQRRHQARVLVIDDDEQVLVALQRLLIPWGIHVAVLDSPLLFLETLDTALPDLLILDIEMPQINGIELCQVVRNHPRWSGLPILFLTAHTDSETMHRVFAAGADDFVCKPIVGPELMTRILNRLERSHLLRILSDTDALTGVANRRKSSQALTELIEWSKHCQQPLCFAILKLNDLGDISQQYGHAVAEQVLARFGELLRQTLHGEDTVGRWGGAEFVVGMAGLTIEDGQRRLAELRNRLHQLEFTTAASQFRATFRAGLVQYPQNGDSLQALYQCAKAALNQEGET